VDSAQGPRAAVKGSAEVWIIWSGAEMKQVLALAKIDRARVLLAEVGDAGSAKKVMDVAHAAEVYACRQRLLEETIGHAHAIKVDAQQLLGEFLRDAPKATRGRGLGEEKSVHPQTPRE